MACSTSCRSKHALQMALEEIKLIKEERDKYRVSLAKQRAARTEDRARISELESLLEEAQSELSDLRREGRERQATVIRFEPANPNETKSEHSGNDVFDDEDPEESDAAPSLLTDLFQAFDAPQPPSFSPQIAKRSSDRAEFPTTNASKPSKRSRLSESSATILNSNSTLKFKKFKGPNSSPQPAGSPTSTKSRKPRTCVTCKVTGCRGAFRREHCSKFVDTGAPDDPDHTKSDPAPASEE